MNTDPTLQAAYLEALRDLTDPHAHDLAAQFGSVADPETRLALAEHSILEADPPDGDGIDPVLLAALSLPDPYAQQGVDRRLVQLRDDDEGEDGDGLAEWVHNRTLDEYDRRVRVSTARLALVVALDAIEQATNDAEAALDEMLNQLDMAAVTPQRRSGVGVRFTHIDSALQTVRMGMAAAKHNAPDPEQHDG